MKKLGPEAIKIHEETKEKVEKLWQKQLGAQQGDK
jgi:hypothetical protein